MKEFNHHFLRQASSGFPGCSDGKKSPCNAGSTWVQSLGQDDPLEKGAATQSTILAWRIPWTEGGAWRAAVQGVATSWTQLSD